jgi:ribosome recycling factor
VWDGGLVTAVSKAIQEANLGLNPSVDGQIVRVNIPELTADRRQELVKAAHKYAENARVAVRHVRREGMDALKKDEKGSGEDEIKRLSEQVQKATDDSIAEIDKMLALKEKDVTQV